jgi:hypothetical protein
MVETTPPFTIESFYGFVKEGKLMGARCGKCGQILVPPKPMCTNCFSKELSWKEFPKQGKLLTYTVIHVSPKQFQSMVPYVVGIVKFEEGAQLPGVIRNVALDAVKVGMTVTVDFEKGAVSDEWPQWPRYYFRPM